MSLQVKVLVLCSHVDVSSFPFPVEEGYKTKILYTTTPITKESPWLEFEKNAIIQLHLTFMEEA